MSTRIVMISDTHSRTPRISQIPNGDVLIHAGDLLQDPHGIKTYQDEIKQLDWIKNASHSFKVVIGGNHDSFLGHLYNNPLAPDSAAKKAIQDAFSDTNHGFRYLQDEACEIVVRGHTWRVFGSPKSLKGNTYAFQHEPGTDPWMTDGKCIIPYNTDILIVHGPPLDLPPIGSQFLDRDQANPSGGDEKLASHIPIACKLVVCGHVHSGAGIGLRHHKGTGKEGRSWTLVNAAGVVSHYPAEPYEEDEMRSFRVVDLDHLTGLAKEVVWQDLKMVQPDLMAGNEMPANNSPVVRMS